MSNLYWFFKIFCVLPYICMLASKINITTTRYQPSAFAAAASDRDDENTITASITRKLAFPDFKDDEKTGAITLLGSAEINRSTGTINIPASSKKHINGSGITSVPQSPVDWSKMAGRALYSFPFRMMDPITNTTASFHTTFSFQMKNMSKMLEAGANDSATASDSGLAFLVVPDELTVGRSGGWLGMMNDACDENYKPFAVEFDTFKNEEFQDPNDHHVGINCGSIISRQTANISDAGVSLRDGSAARAWISYDSSKHLVDVRLAKDGSEKPKEALLAIPLDLSEIFKEYMYVGFSGGAVGSSVHTILSWHFSSDSTGLLRFPKKESCVQHLLPQIATPSRKAPSAFIIFCLVMLIVALAVLNFVCIPYKKRGDEVPTAVKLMRLAREKPRPMHKPRKYTLFEILEASRLFNEGEILGYGKNGVFYKGQLQDSTQVAIKRYSSAYLQQALSSSNKRKIEKEINKLAHVHHPNLVPLRGWCLDKGEILLVYEYMPNGSLDQWLFSQGSIFPWIRRYKIIKELAGALAFLHTNFEKPIVHKNVKLSNVLLDITFRAKLGDYGPCKRVSQVEPISSVSISSKVRDVGLKSRFWKGFMPLATCGNCLMREKKVSHMKCSNKITKFGATELNGGSHQNTHDKEINGKITPQPALTSSSLQKGYIQTWDTARNVRKTTKEDDVNCYGVMLFEIVCGRMVEEESDLVDWVWSLQEEGRLRDAIDEDLRLGASRYYTWEEEATCVLTIGLLCTILEPSLRPSMAMITKYLNGEASLPAVPPRGTVCKVLYPDHSLDYEDTLSPPSKSLKSCTPFNFPCPRSNAHHSSPS